jgi:DNA-binding response OmpR family regulator
LFALSPLHAARFAYDGVRSSSLAAALILMSSREKNKTGRILVVEDDWDILEVLKLMLEYEGHQVATAKHGRAALAVAAARPFDLVVLDISMPEMSGIEVARALRAAEKTAEVYIVIHTGLDEHWVRERFADYDVFLTKAQDADVLVEEIARLLEQPKVAGGRRAASAAVAPTFTTEEASNAQHALRAAMGLPPEALSLPAFLARLDQEIRQLRRLGRSNAEIAEMLSATLGRPISAQALVGSE